MFNRGINAFVMTSLFLDSIWTFRNSRNNRFLKESSLVFFYLNFFKFSNIVYVIRFSSVKCGLPCNNCQNITTMYVCYYQCNAWRHNVYIKCNASWRTLTLIKEPLFRFLGRMHCHLKFSYFTYWIFLSHFWMDFFEVMYLSIRIEMILTLVL